MKTDWELIRTLLNQAIDMCEKIDSLEVSPDDRPLSDGKATVFEYLTSSYIYPENTVLDIIRAKHQTGQDNPYIPETAKILLNVSAVCSNLIGVKDLDSPVQLNTNKAKSIRKMVNNLNDFYRDHAAQGIEAAVKHRNE
ncbi:hypothetical protein SAMN04488136_1494 [Vibrio xiamenensis]|uniref:Uncharacterized protein n=1 Tax=Vibrio xiamenensis TaxID=861298 RepID=A0A1G8HCL4_9VIBR|nr:hypothetical protein [Vibrio xiamenensis]SDI04383.1 hypothetical protein SAMN04488136_1494 [Vibrio xiamenensis]